MDFQIVVKTSGPQQAPEACETLADLNAGPVGDFDDNPHGDRIFFAARAESLGAAEQAGERAVQRLLADGIDAEVVSVSAV